MYKKFLSIIAIFTLATIFNPANAQQPPNPNFENWSTSATFGFLPTGWNGTNYPELSLTGVTRETITPQSGGSSVKMVGKSIMGYNIPGGIALSDVEYLVNGKGKIGIPYTYRPISLSGYYKYVPVNNDKAAFRVVLTKWKNGARLTVGSVENLYGSTVTSWTLFELPINYFSTESPDTINIAFATSGSQASVQVGSVLEIDNISFKLVDTFNAEFFTGGSPCSENTMTFTENSSGLPAIAWEWSVNGLVRGSSKTFSYKFPAVNSPTDFTIKLKATSEKLGPSEITKTITIRPLPKVLITPKNAFVCPGASLTITASGAYSYEWNTSGSTNQITVVPKDYSSYYVVGTDLFGCSNSDATMVFYNKLDTTSTSADFCAGTTYNFYGRSLTAAGTYYHKLISKINGCDSTIKLNLVSKPAPEATLTANNTAVCAGSQVILTAKAGLISYNWGNGATTNNTITFSPTVNTSYSVTVTGTNGCTASGKIDIAIKPATSSQLQFAICNGDSMLINSVWRKTAGSFTRTITNKAGCDSVITTNLVVNPLPVKFLVSGGGSYKPEETGKPVYCSDSETGFTYRLYRGTELVSSLPGTGTQLNFGNQISGEYFIFAQNNTTGCKQKMENNAIVLLNVGVGDLEKNDLITLYPNPASSQIFLSVPGKSNVRIYDLNGKNMLLVKDFVSGYLQIQNFPSGTYLVEVKDSKNTAVRKFVKR